MLLIKTTALLSIIFGIISCETSRDNLLFYHSIDSKIISLDSLTLVKETGYSYYQSKLFTGTAISYYRDTFKTVSIEYNDGKRHGLYKKWFKSGLLSFESHYTYGKRNGLTRTWWENGNLRSESNYDDGVLNGIQTQWYMNGSKFKTSNLNMGKEQGIQQSWRENGKLYNNYEAKNGRIYGLKRAALCYELDDEQIQDKK